MASFNLSAQLFYRDQNVIIHSLMDQQAGRYFLAIPVSQYANFQLFTRLVREDNAKKGTSEYSNETIQRKQFLEDVIKANELIKNLNNGLVYSRINRLKELPVEELTNVLNDNKPFDMNKYKEVTSQIENLINENFRLMTSSNIKNISIEQTILLINEKEQDKEFVEYLKNNLAKENNHKTIEMLREDYEKQKIKLDISEYKEIINNDKKLIIGTNTANEMFSVVFPNQFTMLEVFKMELNTIDKSRFVGLNEKQTARIIFDKIIKDLPSQRMVTKEEQVKQNDENDLENQMLNQKVNSMEGNYLIDKNNNVAINENNKEEVIGIEKNDYGRIESVDNLETQTYDYNPQKLEPNETPVITQSKGKRRVLTRPNGDYGFIKYGTLILFSLSLILTVISLILLISS